MPEVIFPDPRSLIAFLALRDSSLWWQRHSFSCTSIRGMRATSVAYLSFFVLRLSQYTDSSSAPCPAPLSLHPLSFRLHGHGPVGQYMKQPRLREARG